MRRSPARLAAAWRQRRRASSSARAGLGHPVQAVLDAPASPHGGGEALLGRGRAREGQRTSRLTPRGAPGAGVSTERRVCAAATRRGPGRAATSPAAPASQASSASSATHRRDGPAVMLVHAVRARAQPAAEREGARAEPVPRRRASTRALLVANALTRCSGVAPRQRSNERRGAWPSTAIRGEASPPSSLATNARRVHARKPPRPRENPPRPREEAALELARVDRHRHAPGRVVRGGAARQLGEALEPAPRRAATQGDALEALGMGRHRTPRSPERRAAGARSPGPHAAPPHRPGPPAARAARRPPGPVRPQIARPSPSLTPPPRAPTALVRRARGGRARGAHGGRADVDQPRARPVASPAAAKAARRRGLRHRPRAHHGSRRPMGPHANPSPARERSPIPPPARPAKTPGPPFRSRRRGSAAVIGRGQGSRRCRGTPPPRGAARRGWARARPAEPPAACGAAACPGRPPWLGCLRSPGAHRRDPTGSRVGGRGPCEDPAGRAVPGTRRDALPPGRRSRAPPGSRASVGPVRGRGGGRPPSPPTEARGTVETRGSGPGPRRGTPSQGRAAATGHERGRGPWGDVLAAPFGKRAWAVLRPGSRARRASRRPWIPEARLSADGMGTSQGPCRPERGASGPRPPPPSQANPRASWPPRLALARPMLTGTHGASAAGPPCSTGSRRKGAAFTAPSMARPNRRDREPACPTPPCPGAALRSRAALFRRLTCCARLPTSGGGFAARPRAPDPHAASRPRISVAVRRHEAGGLLGPAARKPFATGGCGRNGEHATRVSARTGPWRRGAGGRRGLPHGHRGPGAERAGRGLP